MAKYLEPLSADCVKRLIALNPRAQAEGWDIFDCDEGGLQLQKLDDSDKFQDDAFAWQHVVAKANAGSALHLEALAILRKYEPAEFARITNSRYARKG